MRSKLVRIFAVIVTLTLIIQISLLMKSPIPAEFKNPENTAFALIADDKKFGDLGHKLEVKPITETDGIPVFSSVAVTELGESGLKTKNYQSEGVASDTLFSADSMTKMITAATVLRMTEEEKYQQFLPKGIETKLSDLLPLLKKHYPDSTYIQTQLELQPNFTDITLQHLAQHTSGLARVESGAFRDANRKLTPDEMIDAAKKPKTGEFGERVGEYFYNDLGYELLGRVIVAVDSEQRGRASKFGDVVDELVISRVREKAGEEEKKERSAESLRFFTSDQMEIVDGRTAVASHPELSVKFGKDYHSGKFKETPSHSYDMACGGSYANPESMSKIAFHVLHSSPEFSVFKTPETLEIFNSRQVPKHELDGSLNPQGKTYGFGYESYSHPDYQRYRTHGGLGYGSNSNAFIDTKENRSVVAMVGFENLTLPLAYALINKEKATAPVRLSPELYKKSLELSKNYSESQLVEMRQGLEKSYEEFKEKLEAFQKQRTDALDLQHPKKPSPSPEKSYAEKMVGISKSGAHEI